jgi:hypothetical protein
MKNRKNVTILVVSLALCLGATSAVAQSGTQAHLRSGERLGEASHQTAVAALVPIGGAVGWGHVAVRDVVGDDEVDRRLTVSLFDLEPDAEYAISVDGVELGTVVTDGVGDALLRLGSPEAVYPPVPDALAPAAELQGALIVDASLAPTLEGEFVLAAHGDAGPASLVYAERIQLGNEDDHDVRGVARVSRDVVETQRFTTSGCHLEPGASYEVRVDGAVAGVIVADVVGHAQLTLDSDGDPSTLPAELQPVEDLTLVEWVDADGGTVLVGSFTGESMVGGDDAGHNGGDGDQDGDGPDDDDDGHGGGGNGGHG